MIRATELNGRAVVDLDAAEKLGSIDQIVIDPEARQMVAILVARGGGLLGDRTRTAVPAAALYAIGPDAVTVRRVAGATDQSARLTELPRVSDVIGRTVVSRDGRRLGVIGDVLIDGPAGRIVGYELAESNIGTKLKGLFVERKRPQRPYLRADADLRAGPHLIVAPEDAVCSPNPEENVAPSAVPTGTTRF